jgi:hypothetical protein
LVAAAHHEACVCHGETLSMSVKAEAIAASSASQGA